MQWSVIYDRIMYAELGMYRVVQLNFIPDIEVFYMLFEKSLFNLKMTSLKQHIQSGASYLSQDFVMFFHVSCVSLPGQ